MNILFVNHGGLRSNSMGHIAPYANELCRRGHACAVVIDPEPEEQGPAAPRALFSLYTQQAVLDGAEAFPDARPATLVHAWTPRENVRRFVQAYQSRHPAARLVIHLEDNEEAILESAYQCSIEALIDRDAQRPAPSWIPRLCHPTRYQSFLSTADGVTLLTPSLQRLVPTPKLSQTIRPIVPPATPLSPTRAKEIRKELDLHPNERFIVFPGGITSNNRSDLRDLYLAVALLNDEGHPCRIVKTGPSCPDFEASFAFPLEDICIDLGYVASERVAELLSSADVLIQPGRDNAFNRDRFPCKIPEFLRAGRPCILPGMYGHDNSREPPYCLFLRESSPSEIAELAKSVFTQPELAAELGKQAQAYAAQHFGATANCDQLEAFYQRVLHASPRQRRAEAFQPPNLRLANQRLESERAQLAGRCHELETQSDSLRSELSSLAERIAPLEEALEQQRDRERRLKSTVSWKLTAPLRFLRRHLLDPLTRQPPPARDKRASPTPAADAPEPTPELPPRGHPSYHKNYYRFVQAHQRHIESVLQRCRERPSAFDSGPTVSILLPVYNVAEKWLRKCIDSVIAQAYPHWELCIADDCSTAPHILPVIEDYLQRDPRIRALFRDRNGHISLATNSAFTLASGSYIALLDHDDELPPHALAQVADCIQSHPEVGLIYSDEDKIDENGLRHGPHFKSDWNYDLFLGCNMISHLGVYQRELFEAVGGFREGYEGAQDWDLALRVVEKLQPAQIQHIPDILYHWRNIEGSTAYQLDHKDYANQAQKKAIESHLQRIGVAATLSSVGGFDWKVNYPIPQPAPRVSIVIPSKDRVDLLESCIQSLLEKTRYPNYEIVVVDNDSQEAKTQRYYQRLGRYANVRILRDSGPFNYSRLNNQAILACDSELICLLNNDIEALYPEWLEEMVQHAIRDEIGIVGAKLLYPHGHVQHGGVIMGIGGIAAHAFKYLHKDDDGHIHRAHLVSGYSAVTGACMLFRKQIWTQLGGLNETQLAISYSDVDFCLRAGAAGYRTLCTPFALLAHKESQTRGDPLADPTQAQRFQQEMDYMRQTWGPVIDRDPYYNPNLTRDREDFSYRW